MTLYRTIGIVFCTERSVQKMKIIDYEHVGIRVSNRLQALEFYGKLGFIEEKYFPKEQASELVSDGGVYLNLISMQQNAIATFFWMNR